MAQDQRVDVLFAAQVTGQNQLEKLTQAVEKLRQETEQLKNANGSLASSTDAVIRNGKRYNNELDAQAKALRQARQGTQQLGLQVNDFFTSVSTGASPVQALNQQLGQLGYAMSLMGGTAGKVGAFLAGPWGAAILVATMGLGYLIEKLIGTDESAEKAGDKIKDLGQQFDFAAMTGEDLARVNQLLAESNSKIAQTAIQAANATAAKAAADSNAAQQALNLAKAELAKRKAVLGAMKEPTAFAGGGVAGAALTAGQFATNRQNQAIDEQIKKIGTLEDAVDGFNFRQRQFTAESYALTSAMDGSSRAAEVHNARINDLRNSYARGEISLQAFRKAIDSENAALARLEESGKDGGRSQGRQAKEKKKVEERNKALEEFNKLVERHTQKAIPEYVRSIEEMTNSYEALSLKEQTILADDFGRALDAIDARRIAEDFAALNLVDGVLPELAATLGKMTPLQDEINSGAEAMQSSFEAVGNTVSEVFKGMLTGAMSWKEGVKSLIGSVIAELWKLYVVKQIVGFFTDTVMPALGLPAPKALGGSVGKNQPYMVGERGPELFIPGGSGTIIPNRNLGGGKSGNSFNINVDARGSADPAAVRAQVQQGILEAAPAIIAAAEARTVGGLRRPRLGGVIQ